MQVVDFSNGRDDGAGARVHPCTKRTWCVLHVEHDGPCVEVPKRPLPSNDYGPKRKAR